MRLDLHAHVEPPAFRRQAEGLGADLRFGQGPGELLAAMDRWSIDASVVSVGSFGSLPASAGRGLLAKLARAANEKAAELVRERPDRFGAVGVLPLPPSPGRADLDLAVEEVGYALDDLGLDGIMLRSNSHGSYLGDASLDPVLAALGARGAYVFVHPADPPVPSPLPYPVWLVELPFDTTRAFVNMLYSGTFDRFPAIRFQFAHLGGTATFLAHRIRSLVHRAPEWAAGITADPLEYLTRVWYDTALSNHRPAIAAVRAAGLLGRAVYGTDFPWGQFPGAGDDPAPDLACLGAHREAVDAINAAALVPRLTRKPGIR